MLLLKVLWPNKHWLTVRSFVRWFVFFFFFLFDSVSVKEIFVRLCLVFIVCLRLSHKNKTKVNLKLHYFLLFATLLHVNLFYCRYFLAGEGTRMKGARNSSSYASGEL